MMLTVLGSGLGQWSLQLGQTLWLHDLMKKLVMKLTELVLSVKVS